MHIELQRRSVASLTPYANNVKRHAPEDVAAIAASIRRFGFNDPIGVTPDGEIVEGEGRWMAARELGMEDVPVVVLHGLEPRDINIYRIAHNKIALSTGFNLEALVTTLRSLVDHDITLSVMGFDEETAARLLGSEAGNSASILPSMAQGRSSFEVHECIAIWDSEDEKTEFEAFLQAIRHPGESAADALIRRIEETVYAAQTVGTVEEHAHV